jgi:hypothetical protein
MCLQKSEIVYVLHPVFDMKCQGDIFEGILAQSSVVGLEILKQGLLVGQVVVMLQLVWQADVLCLVGILT